MSEPTLYRSLDKCDVCGFDEDEADTCFDRLPHQLYAIVEPCEHGNTGRHIIEDTIKVYSRGPDWEWCDGKPKEGT